MISTHFCILLPKSNWSLLLSCGPAGLSVPARGGFLFPKTGSMMRHLKQTLFGILAWVLHFHSSFFSPSLSLPISLWRPSDFLLILTLFSANYIELSLPLPEGEVRPRKTSSPQVGSFSLPPLIGLVSERAAKMSSPLRVSVPAPPLSFSNFFPHPRDFANPIDAL